MGAWTRFGVRLELKAWGTALLPLYLGRMLRDPCHEETTLGVPIIKIIVYLGSIILGSPYVSKLAYLLFLSGMLWILRSLRNSSDRIPKNGVELPANS